MCWFYAILSSTSLTVKFVNRVSTYDLLAVVNFLQTEDFLTLEWNWERGVSWVCIDELSFAPMDIKMCIKRIFKILNNRVAIASGYAKGLRIKYNSRAWSHILELRRIVGKLVAASLLKSLMHRLTDSKDRLS